MWCSPFPRRITLASHTTLSARGRAGSGLHSLPGSHYYIFGAQPEPPRCSRAGSFSPASRLGRLVCRALRSHPFHLFYVQEDSHLGPRVRQLGLRGHITIQRLRWSVNISPVPWSHTSCVCADRSEMMGCNEIKVRQAQLGRPRCTA